MPVITGAPQSAMDLTWHVDFGAQGQNRELREPFMTLVIYPRAQASIDSQVVSLPRRASLAALT